VEQISWIVLLLFAAGLLIALVKGGWTGSGGAKAWFDAKFLGKTA
jgi:hypothetical protein